MAMNLPLTTEVALPWRGIHHIAMATPDLDASIQFYGNVLGMSVSDVFSSREGRGRHCLVFVKPGDSDIWGLHFFERAVIPASTQADTPDDSAMMRGPLLHIAFRLPNDISAGKLRERLHDHSITITEIAELGSFIFWDNNGVMLEVTWPKT